MKKSRTLLLSISFIFILGFISCSKEVYLSQVSYDRELISDSISADSAVWAIIEPYKENLDDQMNREIAFCAEAMLKQQPEGGLGNFMADAMMWKADSFSKDTVHFAVMNYGGIRIPAIPRGPVSIGKLFELMPFENELVILDMDGDAVAEIFDRMALAGGWPVSGARYDIQDGKAINIRIGGKPFNITQVYRMVISDYLANGGDKCYFLEHLPREAMDIKLRDVLIEKAEFITAQGDSIFSPVQGRVKNAE